MRISILDQAPISTHMTAEEALGNSVKLASVADQLGYTRFWLAEHHGMKGLASSAPEVTLGAIGMITKDIRLGSGATLLPYYKPLKVAETFNTLLALHGDRIDVGIGRAPGGDNVASEALSDNYLGHVFKMPDLVSELSALLMNKRENLKVMPDSQHQVKMWMLGTSEKSAIFARDNQLNYCYGEFMSSQSTDEVLSTYKAGSNNGEIIVTVNTFCGQTFEEAERMARPYLVNQALKSTGREFSGIPTFDEVSAIELTEEEVAEVNKIRDNVIIGDADFVRQKLMAYQRTYGVDEVMVVTITHDFSDKVKSYKRIAEVMLNN